MEELEKSGKIENCIWNEEYNLEDSKNDLGVPMKIILECSICLTCIKKGDIISKLQCGHYFHKECIINWLKHKRHCPLDRTRV